MVKIDWRTLTASLNKMKEQKVKALLDEEISTHKRSAFARRLHQRYSSLRTARERAEIMKELGK